MASRNWINTAATGIGLATGQPWVGPAVGLVSSFVPEQEEKNKKLGSVFPEQSPAASYGIPADIGMPFQGQHGYQGGSLSRPKTPQINTGVNTKSMADKLMANTATGGSVPEHRKLMQGNFVSEPEGLNKNYIENMSLFGGSGVANELNPIWSGQVTAGPTSTQPGTNTQTPVQGEAGPIDDAIRATEMTNKLGLGSDIAKILVNMGGLMNPMEISKPFSSDRIEAPEYKDSGEQMRGDLNQSLGVSNALLKDLSPEQRIAGVSESMNAYQQGQRDISRHETEVANMNAAARAEAENQNTALDLELQQANYQKNMIENQAEHMRKQVGVSEIMKSVDSIINRGGQSGMNTAGLRLLKDMWPSLDDEARAEFMSIFNV